MMLKHIRSSKLCSDCLEIKGQTYWIVCERENISLPLINKPSTERSLKEHKR